MSLYIGLMSGTSLDAIDASLVEISDKKVVFKNAVSYPIPPSLKQQLLKLISNKGDDTIDLLGEVDAQLGILFADACNQLLKNNTLTAKDIKAIGSHGQTIRHRPENNLAFTLQIGDASRIAELTGITTVTDFRRRDIAAGGQGAPLVPAFHRAVFSSATEHRCIVNIGGMANISYLPKNNNEATSGFDTGPGNVLLDSWCQRHTGKPYDKNGDWARSGTVSEKLLEMMLKDPYFSQSAPKSTGREHFNNDWLEQHISSGSETAENIQASLTDLTAKTIVDAIKESFPKTEQIVVCGGGSYNLYLNERLNYYAGKISVQDSSQFGIDPDWVEATAFAWLAHCTLNGITANEPAVTGAHSRVILGAIYLA